MDGKPHFIHSYATRIDEGYTEWLEELKGRFQMARTKAAVKVNAEQLLFNWQLGRDLVERKVEERWGAGVVEQVSLDLKAAFPAVNGFSARNLWNMKKWYLFYSDKGNAEKLQQLVAELQQTENPSGQKLQQVVGELQYADYAASQKLHQVGGEIQQTLKPTNQKLHQVGAEIHEDIREDMDGMAFPSLFSFVPWRHHVEIITKCKAIDEALFYIRKVIQEGWSRRTLGNCLHADLYKHQGGAISNFADILPPQQSSLAQEMTKDTYDFGFISLPPDYDEEVLETELEKNIARFLLELGMGFAFIGRQVELIVAGKSRRVDMLFYHARLHCYIVCELKAKSFEPEFAGKLNFYVNAVDELLKTEHDNPTIGLLICRDKNQTEVKWAFKGIQTPMGVASYDNIRIKELRDALPSEEELIRQMRLLNLDSKE